MSRLRLTSKTGTWSYAFGRLPRRHPAQGNHAISRTPLNGRRTFFVRLQRLYTFIPSLLWAALSSEKGSAAAHWRDPRMRRGAAHASAFRNRSCLPAAYGACRRVSGLVFLEPGQADSAVEQAPAQLYPAQSSSCGSCLSSRASSSADRGGRSSGKPAAPPFPRTGQN